MRTFKCNSCDHTWSLPFGSGGRGVRLTCPACGSENIHRLKAARGWGRGRQGPGGVVTAGEEFRPGAGGRRRRRREAND
jgi:predicted RNA-binding Zn-ribbon protein involved in translation (DUF1610 family)